MVREGEIIGSRGDLEGKGVWREVEEWGKRNPGSLLQQAFLCFCIFMACEPWVMGGKMRE